MPNIKSIFISLQKLFHSYLSYLFSYPAEDIVDKKERLFQTYLVIFSLLSIYDRIPEVQQSIMQSFAVFTIVALIYYIFLTRFRRKVFRVIFNILAVIMGLYFSIAFSTFVGFISTDCTDVSTFYPDISILTLVIVLWFLTAISLFV